MSVQRRIEKYSRLIWENQLPREEEQFLQDLLAGRPSAAYRGDSDSDCSLFFACHAAQNAYAGCSTEQTAECKAILQTYKMQRMQKIPAMAKVFKLLNENGIIPVLLKGAAMMCCYAPDIPRMMGDIDFWIRPEQFDKAVSLILDNGFEYVNDTGYHVAAASKYLDMDIHRYIYKNGGDVDSGIFERLIRMPFLGAEVAVLPPEEMLLHQLANRGRDLSFHIHENRHLKWVVDCWYILKVCSPGMQSLLERAAGLNNLFHVQLPLLKLAELFPDSFADKCACFDEKKYMKWLRYVKRSMQIRLPDENMGKFSYFFSAVRWAWLAAKISKISYGSKEPVFKVMMHLSEINTADDVLRRIKKYCGASGFHCL